MPLTEERALEILAELIKKPESKAEDIPRIWDEIIGVYNKAYAPVVPELPKKKRRRGPANPNIGWPAGVKRAEYTAWKEAQVANGVTDGLNPQEFKRLKDAGLVSDVPAQTAAPEPKAKAAKANGSTNGDKPAKATKTAPKGRAAAKK